MVTISDAVLNVVGVDVAAAQDEHVLEAPRHIQLALPQEAQVASPEEPPAQTLLAGYAGLDTSQNLSMAAV